MVSWISGCSPHGASEMAERALRVLDGGMSGLKKKAAEKSLQARTEIEQQITASATDRLEKRQLLVHKMQRLMDESSISEADAARLLIKQCVERLARNNVRTAATALARRGRVCPSVNSLVSWYRQAQEKGKQALSDKLRGRRRKNYGWEARALELYNSPNRPQIGTLVWWLQQEGHTSAKYNRVYTYIRSLPADLGEHGRARVGERQWKGKHTPYVVRDKSSVPVGFVYEADGHTCDVYVAHPVTGGVFRAELTVWIDVASNYVVGHLLTESESAVTTLLSLGRAVSQHDHVPAMIHVDPGSGYRARMITDDVSGLLARLDIKHSEALPGNWRGKGLTEGFFKHFEERFGKRWATYCGHCRTDEALSRLQDKIKRGEIELPQWDEYCNAMAEYFEAHNQTPQRGLGMRAPADLWARLENVPSHIDPMELIRPREQRKVTYQRVQMFNRKYQATAGELAGYEGQTVLVEFDQHDMTSVVVRDLKGRFICDAGCVDKQAWLSDSHLQDLRQKRQAGQARRLQHKLDETRARARPLIELAEQDDRAELIDNQTPKLEHSKRFSIDPLKTDY